ncbi:MAG: helix-hairpin-helix domain-containing protein [Limisphaerales bacterium]
MPLLTELERGRLGPCSYKHAAPNGAVTRGSILVGLLWCLALLSLVVVGVLHTTRMDLVVVKNYGDKIQAHYLAVAGIEKAKALLYRDARERSRNAVNHNGALYDAGDQLRDVQFGRGLFRVFRRGRPDEGGAILFGVSDEESRLNVNGASNEELAKLDGMTPDITAAIVDWRSSGNEVTPGGAKADYYLSLRPPYLPRNGPLQTIRELLMVRGVSPELLLGRDFQQNGLIQPFEEGGTDAVVEDVLDTGWAALLTVDSSVNNVNAAGYDRVNIQTADEAALTGVSGITSDIAKAIVAWRAQNRFSSIADLLDVAAAQDNNRAGGPGNAVQGQAPGNPQTANLSGPKVVSDSLLMDIGDDVTVEAGADLAGVVNINTASLEVLACLPGLNRQLAQAIISFRQSSGFFSNVAWLLRVPGMTPDLFRQVCPRVTARSETFRILSEGKVTSTGARQRIQEIVHVGLRSLTTVSYREDDL